MILSTFKVPLLTISHVEHHPNADRLDLVMVADMPCVVGRDQYKVGDRVIYVPVDSVIPDSMVERISQGSKIALKNRIKAVKIRGIVSQGLILTPKDWLSPTEIPYYSATTIGEAPDVSSALSIVKYEEPVKLVNSASGVKRSRPGNPNFKYYTDIENITHYPNVFVEGEPVWISEKLHGTSFRCGWFPKVKFTVWERIKKFFGLYVDNYEFCYGSRKVDISASTSYVGYYGSDIYGRCASRYNLRTIVPRGYAVYGEIIGPSIQKDYSYGLEEHQLYVYDILKEGKWVNPLEMLALAHSWGLETVPSLVIGKPYNMEYIRRDYCDNRISVIDSTTPREGVVIKPLVERNDPKCGRVVLKMINPVYLLKDTTDFH